MISFIISADKDFFYAVPTLDREYWRIANKIQLELMKGFI